MLDSAVASRPGKAQTIADPANTAAAESQREQSGCACTHASSRQRERLAHVGPAS